MIWATATSFHSSVGHRLSNLGIAIISRTLPNIQVAKRVSIVLGFGVPLIAVETPKSLCRWFDAFSKTMTGQLAQCGRNVQKPWSDVKWRLAKRLFYIELEILRVNVLFVCRGSSIICDVSEIKKRRRSSSACYIYN